MKDTACWETLAGNYVDEVETRDGLDLERRKREGLGHLRELGGMKKVSQLVALIFPERLQLSCFPLSLDPNT